SRLSRRTGHPENGGAAAPDAYHVLDLCNRHDGPERCAALLFRRLDKGGSAACNCALADFPRAVLLTGDRCRPHCALHDSPNYVRVFRWSACWLPGCTRKPAGYDNATHRTCDLCDLVQRRANAGLALVA